MEMHWCSYKSKLKSTRLHGFRSLWVDQEELLLSPESLLDYALIHVSPVSIYTHVE